MVCDELPAAENCVRSGRMFLGDSKPCQPLESQAPMTRIWIGSLPLNALQMFYPSENGQRLTMNVLTAGCSVAKLAGAGSQVRS